LEDEAFEEEIPRAGELVAEGLEFGRGGAEVVDAPTDEEDRAARVGKAGNLADGGGQGRGDGIDGAGKASETKRDLRSEGKGIGFVGGREQIKSEMIGSLIVDFAATGGNAPIREGFFNAVAS